MLKFVGVGIIFIFMLVKVKLVWWIWIVELIRIIVGFKFFLFSILWVLIVFL